LVAIHPLTRCLPTAELTWRRKPPRVASSKWT
jgi:hypothetical protein